MELNETLQKILNNAEETLDKMTGETPESRAAAKEKVRKFFKNMMGGDDKKAPEKEKDENNN